MPVTVEPLAPTQLSAANLRPRGSVHPSPTSWRDQILYFLLPDRFSDVQEHTRPLFDRIAPAAFRTQDKGRWMSAGKRFQGGTLKGIEGKLGYLQDLGVTTLWIGPVWRQRSELETYHGYGIQNFLDVDPRFGTRQDLRDLIDAAHARRMYVLLDIIYNHTGNNWFYSKDGAPHNTRPYRDEPPYPFHSWRSGVGTSTPAIAAPGDGVWPAEFQDPDWYTRAGQIGRWDPEVPEDALRPNVEFRRGDFYDLKDLKLNEHEAGSQEVLSALARVYQYWIALSDCDGFRIDTVKHVSFETSRNFCGAIHEFAESIGKENFWLLGEVTGGSSMTKSYLDVFGRNLDAALDIGAPADLLAGTVRGLRDPADFFGQFSGHDQLGSHRMTGRYHVSVLDDHDMVGRSNGKRRFAAGNQIPNKHWQAAHAVGAQFTTLGVPCVYYGTEQAFDGTEDRHDPQFEPVDQNHQVPFGDRYIREAMFGGAFGAFATERCHFFDSAHPTYLRIAALARVRNRRDQIGLALRRGRQYRRETSFLGRPYSLPGRGELVAWSRVLFNREVLVALNTHGTEVRGAEITIDAALHPHLAQMTIFYRADWSEAELRQPPQGETIPVHVHNDGRVTVRVDLPPAGMIILS